MHYDKWIKYERDKETGEVIQHGLYSRYMDAFIKLKAVSRLSHSHPLSLSLSFFSVHLSLSFSHALSSPTGHL